MNKDWIRSTCRDLQLYYNPNVGDKLRMDTSTNALGANPAGQRELVECTKLNVGQYPNTYGDKLREELAKLYGMKADNFVVGNGSDEVLDIIMKTFMEPGETVITAHPAYVLHSFFVKINGGRTVTVDLNDDFQLDVDKINSTPGKVVLLCTPNNPTANTFRVDDLKAVIEGADRPVIVDEAYGEYTNDTFLPLVDRYDNLMVTRTFSKAYGLAGMRIGYLAAGIEMAEALQKVKIPYSLNMIGERVAIAALRDREFLERSVRLVNQERPFLSKGLSDLGFQVFPSEANYILFRPEMPSDVLTKKLSEKGVLVRDFGKVRRLENCIRTTIGTREMNTVLLDRMREVLRECR
ncbi:MAG TPA: histidinol-phosphate transaminase [Methanomassiliicoccales archaeon]|nr:histidinol-phosphate transaminase [Methanomassiliicoccales archaeon]HPR98757.1 histidinol-phosphate transaminase [Methanomassiliicoccales archaeon]